MISKNILLLIILTILINLKVLAIENIYIAYKIDDEIITNIDIKKESRYLIALNQQLETLKDDQLLNASKQSLIKETIKKKEVLKYFKLDQTDPYLDIFMENLYLRLKLANLDELENYLQKYNLTLPEVKKKFEIEHLWNKIIYEMYKNRINIDEDKIKQSINEKKLNTNTKVYSLSEIIFEKDQDISMKDKMKKISESIKEIGFKNTANLYSIADSAKYGGDIGWVEEDSLSKEVSTILNETGLGNQSKVIKLNGNFLILNIDDIKYKPKEFDEEKEFQMIYRFELDKKLEQFSKIYFKKIKINTKIDEL